MSCRLKHLAVAAAIIGLATQTWADSGYFPGSTDLQANNPLADGLWVDGGAAEVVTDASVADIAQAANKPSGFVVTRTSVLSVDHDNDAPIVRNLKSGGTAPSVTTNVYADVLVKGYPLANDAADPEAGPTDKILVYTRVNAAGTDTNLCVLAKETSASLATNEFVLTKSIDNGWHRIVIVAKTDGTYQVYCDNLTSPCTTGSVNAFYPINSGAAMTSVAFAGTGYVDDIILSTFNPVDPVHTLTWPTSLASVSYTVDGVAGDALTATSGTNQFQAAQGAEIIVTGNNGYRTFKQTETIGAGATTIDFAELTGIAKYFPADNTSAGQNGSAEHPYEIPNVAALQALARAANEGLLAGGNLHFIQTANIDMSTAGAFGGIGAVGAENDTTLTLNAFEGVYDGGNYTISNITFTNRKGSALFNLVRNATIKDLTVDTVSYEAPFAAAKLGGAMVVGNGVNCTLQHIVTLGSNGAGNPSTYNAAGIANRLEGRGGPVLVIGCTNNAAIYGCYSKVGGICPIVQGADQTVTFVDCANNGNIVANGTSAQTEISGKTPGTDGVAGILAFTQGGDNLLSFTNCVNTGTITGVSGSRVASILGYTTASGITAVGGSAQADIKSVDSGANKVTGLKFATVDNGVATFVADDALALNGSYKVMSGNATATYNFTALGTISFDEALSTPTYAITSSAPAGYPVASTSGTVTTYTAGYFPRTATAGQDGTAEHPFEIHDLDDLEALQAYADTTNCANIAFVQTDDIALTNAWKGIGVGAGKDLVNGSGKNIPKYEEKAFSGTYDGGNYTISNFQMANGCDYGALFNSVNNATIKNLKISYKENKLCANSSSSGGDTGASFVGVARNSTLQNLTALATGTVTTVSASKDMGGIVGYLMCNSTVDSCTNELNIASYKNTRKCGGIAIITQDVDDDGTGSAVIRNCKNSGTVTTPSSTWNGALVGYANVNTTIDGCENTANVKLMHVHDDPTITVTGTNKGYAGVASNDKGVTNLFFATVSGDVATFVADDALALNGSYKVMSTGATATFVFAEAGTIAFDTALFAPTYAITATEGLTLTDATVGTVKTYTAAAPAPAYPTYVDTTDADITSAYTAWASTYSADDAATSQKEAQFVLDVDPATVVPADALVITAIEQNTTDGGWDITVECTMSGVDLEGTLNSARVNNGYLAISYASDLGGLWTTENIDITASAAGKVTVNVNKNGAKFMKAKLSAKAEPASAAAGNE